MQTNHRSQPDQEAQTRRYGPAHRHGPARSHSRGCIRAVAFVCVVAAVLDLAAPAAGRATGRVRVTGSLPREASAQTPIEVTGRVVGAPAGSRVALQKRRARGKWTTIVVVPIRRGRFLLWWRPRAREFVTLRLAVRHRGHDLASSATQQLLVGWAPKYCPEPSPPVNVPPGDGWIVGGVYLSGGPAPGIFACYSGSTTVTVIDETGATVATEQLAGQQSYAFVLAPGRYTLEFDSCISEPAVVSAGAPTKANTVCNIA